MKQLFKNSKFEIFDYFPCPCKIPIKKIYFGIKCLFVNGLPKFLLHTCVFYDKY